jgi:hypothetical protein
MRDAKQPAREATMGFIREDELVAVERAYPGIRRLAAWARPTSLLELLSLYERWSRVAPRAS